MSLLESSPALTFNLAATTANYKVSHHPHVLPEVPSLAQLTIPTTAKSKKAIVKYCDIERKDGLPLRWVHITQPNHKTLQSVASSFGIKLNDLQPSLTPNRPPHSYRYGAYLANRFTEFKVEKDSQKGLIVRENSVLGVLGNTFLITISDQNSPTCERVWDEVAHKEIGSEETSSSNHLFSRMFGGSLHRNECAAYAIEAESEIFLHHTAGCTPTNEQRAHFLSLSEAVLDARQALQNNPEVIHSLREAKNLFGAPVPREALERYEVIHNTATSRLDRASQFLQLTRDDWRVAQDEMRNSTLYRLTLLTGALAPISLVASLFGINFPDGLPYSTSSMYALLGTSMLVLSALVAGLVLRGWQRKKTI